MAIEESGIPIELVSSRMEFKQKLFLTDSVEYEDSKDEMTENMVVQAHDLHTQLILSERALEDLQIF